MCAFFINRRDKRNKSLEKSYQFSCIHFMYWIQQRRITIMSSCQWFTAFKIIMVSKSETSLSDSRPRGSVAMKHLTVSKTHFVYSIWTMFCFIWSVEEYLHRLMFILEWLNNKGFKLEKELLKCILYNNRLSLTLHYNMVLLMIPLTIQPLLYKNFNNVMKFRKIKF